MARRLRSPPYKTHVASVLAHARLVLWLRGDTLPRRRTVVTLACLGPLCWFHTEHGWRRGGRRRESTVVGEWVPRLFLRAGGGTREAAFVGDPHGPLG